jgi:transposase
MNRSPTHWEEARRLQAWLLKQLGWAQRRIAEALGVSEGAVSQWMRRARAEGPDALRHHPPPGAARRLPSEQLARLPELLTRGPATYGFRGDVWTRRRIAVVIRLEGGVTYHPTHVGRQRDEAAITRWREDFWPAIKRGRKPSSQPSSC